MRDNHTTSDDIDMREKYRMYINLDIQTEGCEALTQETLHISE